MMAHLPSNFHFLRPLWLLALPPAGLLAAALWRRHGQASGWRQAIDELLLPHLLESTQNSRQGWPFILLLLAWLLACLALAGPVWEKLPQPVQRKEDALIIIQDLSLSMYAQDLSPNRLTRAQHKLLDILQARREGATALVVYAGEAHTVCPLTNDSKTIAALVPALSPAIMPSFGSNVQEAMALALQLLTNAGLSRGRILLITDEVTPAAIAEITKLLADKTVSLAVLGVGTEAGGPIPKNDGGFLQDDQGVIVVPRLDPAVLREQAAATGGRYHDISLGDDDITCLLGGEAGLPGAGGLQPVERQFDQWQEQGHWLVLLILPMAALAWRRGWLLGLVLILGLWSGESQAMSWQDLWLTRDQQGARVMAQGEPGKAAALFTAPPWQGAAQYRAGKYAEAAAAFAHAPSAEARYNEGNALAKAGKLPEAIKAYEQALQLDPKLEDARFNKELVEKLLHKQQQQSQEKQQQDQQQGQEQNQASRGQQGQDAQQQQGRDNQAAEQPPQDQGKETAKQEPGPGDQQDRRQSGQPDARPAPKETEQKTAEADEQKMSAEERQALEQWLRQVPDDPGGLLRRKFEYESRNNQRQQQRRPATKIW